MRGQPPPPPDPLVDDRFEEAYRTSGSAVLGYALRRCASREDAFDVVAETFAVAWRRRGDLPADAAEVRPWLFGIARLCVANAARSRRRAGRLGQRLAEAFAGTPLPDPVALSEGRAGTRELADALGRLSAEDRELVTLVAWEGLTPAEAAIALGLTPGAARVRLHRARARLRAELDPNGTTEEDDRDQ
ncbi:RNA polymerase sigma factor [Blastococcus sp. TF02A-26]|uniref:RNA polymerase sigma factor n=1 Tax=Blastococcus sp. TF02A-26 TaxID=2250577 RepID=UPI000DEBF8EA|nr:sigma-70 family RNA polymerase sigma factor [Blastococcus sp. TF02A-26]RBY81945.1 RNA polymerase subunit sigma-24 [Blastococcus sp. TF02A-26]